MADNSKNTNPEPRGYICAVALVIAVPVVITVLYNIHLFDYDAIPSGDLLQYAGICLGLFHSARMLVFERRKEEARREEKRREERIRFRPKLAISIEEQANRYLKMTMTNIGSKTIFQPLLCRRVYCSIFAPRARMRSASLQRQKRSIRHYRYC